MSPNQVMRSRESSSDGQRLSFGSDGVLDPVSLYGSSDPASSPTVKYTGGSSSFQAEKLSTIVEGRPVEKRDWARDRGLVKRSTVSDISRTENSGSSMLTRELSGLYSVRGVNHSSSSHNRERASSFIGFQILYFIREL